MFQSFIQIHLEKKKEKNEKKRLKCINPQKGGVLTAVSIEQELGGSCDESEAWDVAPGPPCHHIASCQFAVAMGLARSGQLTARHNIATL